MAKLSVVFKVDTLVQVCTHFVEAAVTPDHF